MGRLLRDRGANQPHGRVKMAYTRKKHVSASFIAQSQKFAATTADWARLEDLYCPLSEEDRGSIISILNEYFIMEALDLAAPTKKSALSNISSIRAAAKKLSRELNARSDLEAAQYVEMLIEQKWPGGPKPLVDFQSEVASLLLACKKVEDEIEGTDGEGKQARFWGRPWEGMIRSLINFLKGKGYPTGAANVGTRREVYSASKFVKFVDELQKLFPDEFRHYTDRGLPKAINAARRRQKRKLSP
jgi:hypothetical protein